MTNVPDDKDVIVTVGDLALPAILAVPRASRGLVVFAHGSGSSRLSSRNRAVAATLVERGCATLLFDLLTPLEAQDRANVFDIELLGERVEATIAWARGRDEVGDLPIGCFGASTGAAAALVAAATLGSEVAAVVSRGGRPDLAGRALPQVTAPTLLLVGSLDTVVLELNREAQRQLRCDNKLVVIEGATHLFEEPGTLAAAAGEAAIWFTEKFDACPARGGH